MYKRLDPIQRELDVCTVVCTICSDGCISIHKSDATQHVLHTIHSIHTTHSTVHDMLLLLYRVRDWCHATNVVSEDIEMKHTHTHTSTDTQTHREILTMSLVGLGADKAGLR